MQFTDWNSKDKAREWREALAETINTANARLGIGTHWEHRSNEELGLDTVPEIHLGQCATALERKGIRTERGDINREIRMTNARIVHARTSYLTAKRTLEHLLAKPAEVVRKAKTEIGEMLDKVSAKFGRLELPVNTSKYLKHVTGREKMQDVEAAMQWLDKHNIRTYAELHSFIQKCERSYGENTFLRNDNVTALKRLHELVDLYNGYQPFKKYHDESKALTGKAKQKYDATHAKELRQYTEKRQALLAHLDGEKIMPKHWKAELAEIEKVLPELNRRWGDDVINLSMGEIIEHNREKVERAERYERTPREPERSTQEQRKKQSEPSL